MKRHANARGKQRGPLSQTGIPHIPQNPKQRVPEEGGGKRAGQVLDAFNDKQETRQLHPTKGWRELNEKRTRAAMIVASILAPRFERQPPKVVTDATGSRSKYMPHIGFKERGRYAA